MKFTNTFKVEIEITYFTTEQGNKFFEEYQKFYKKYSNQIPTLEETIQQYITEMELGIEDNDLIDSYAWVEEKWWFKYLHNEDITEELTDFANELAEFLAFEVAWSYKKQIKN